MKLAPLITSLVAIATLAAADVTYARSEAAAIAQVRAGTGRYHSLDRAIADGYAQFQGCVSEPGQGAMGQHYVNGALAGDTVLDPTRPEALMYEEQNNGRMELLGAEFIVFAEAWDAANQDPPSLFGHTFHFVPFPNRYGIPAFYALHVWAWRDNPAGTFENWNPTVQCP